MALLQRFIAGCRTLLYRTETEQELDAELREFLQTSADHKMRHGLNRAQAMREARMEMGGVEVVKDRVRDVSWETKVEGVWQDLLYALRSLRKAPGFTAIAIVTLALGSGATTAIFSVVYGVLLKPLPFSDPERLVGVWTGTTLAGGQQPPMSASLYFTYRDDNRVFEDIGLWDDVSYSVTGSGEPEQVQVLAVTEGLLPILGTQPLIGRRFTPADDSPGGSETAILTFGYWQNRFGGDRSVLGRTIVVNGRPREIVGVLPHTFRFLNQQPAMLLPFRFDRNRLFLGQFSYQAVAKLRPGVTVAQANTDAARMLNSYTGKWPPPPGGSVKMFEDARLTPDVRPLKQDAIGDVGNVLWVLMATIGIVLLIACANVANLLLVRLEGRHQELAVRAAIGAGRIRIAGGLLFESLLLAMGGGIVGLGVASAALQVLAAIAPSNLPRQSEIAIDAAALAFSLGIALGAGLLFGLVPMIRDWSPRGQALGSGGRTIGHGAQQQRARNALVVVQVALALVLLISSGLMLRTFQAMRRVDPGFSRPEDVRTLRVSIPPAHVQQLERVVRMQHDILENLRRIGSVSAGSFTSSVPMDGNSGHDPVFVEDRPLREGEPLPVRQHTLVSPGFFQTIGNPIRAGRDFTWTDVYEMRPVTLVAENVARELWNEPSAALGRRIRGGVEGPWREIVGVVGDIRDDGVHQKPSAAVYFPVLASQLWGQPTYAARNVAFAIRTPRTDDDALLEEIQQAVWAVNPNLPLANVRTLAELYERSMAPTSFALVMLAIAGGMALVLGLVGIYSVISYAVAQRTREIGIRVALGAPQESVRRMFVRHGMVLALMGVVGGVAVAAGLMRVMASLLFEVSAVDPITYAAVSVGLVAAVLVATYVPARRATRVDPLVALRYE